MYFTNNIFANYVCLSPDAKLELNDIISF